MSSSTVLARVEETASSVAALGGDSQAFEVAQRMARALSSSTIVPADYRGNIANVMVAMEYANRLGASVLAVMQNLDVIHGRPSLRSTFLIGTVNATGRFTPIRYRWQGEQGTDEWGCRAVAKDRESGEECPGPLVTIAIAKAEGWYNKTGSKWKTIPELMLMYRAGGWWTRVYCPDLTLGLHTTDEIEDIATPVQYQERAVKLAQVLDAGDVSPRQQLVGLLNWFAGEDLELTDEQRDKLVHASAVLEDDDATDDELTVQVLALTALQKQVA